MEAAEAEPLPVKDALDSGQTLVPRQLRELLDLQASVPEGELHAAIAALNEEGTAPRALLGAHLPSVHVKGLIAAAAANGRRSILVFLSKADQPRKRKRGRPDGLPAGPRWQGNGLGGRVDFLDMARGGAPPVIGKRSCTQRQKDATGKVTAEMTVHSARRVTPAPAPARALRVQQHQLAADGTLTVHAAGHPFSGSNQLATLRGLPAGLDGLYAVNPAQSKGRQRQQGAAGSSSDDAGSSDCAEAGAAGPSTDQAPYARSSFRVKLPKAEAAAAAAAIQEAVASGRVQVSEKHVLEECPEIIQLTLETAPPAAQPAASDADLELALDALDDFLGQPGGGFDLLDGGLGLPDLSSLPSYPGAAGQQQQQQQGPGEASDVASGSAAQPAAARVLERARALDAAQRSVAVAADLALRLFQQEGAEAQRLGLVAQQVRQVLERRSARELDIVREDAQGQLAVDYGGLQPLATSALQAVLADAKELRQARGALLLAVAGRLQALAAEAQQRTELGSSGEVAADGSSSNNSGSSPGAVGLTRLLDGGGGGGGGMDEMAEVVVVAPAEQDAAFAARLGAFALAAVEEVTTACAAAGLAEPLPKLPVGAESMLSQGRWCATAVRWAVGLAERLQAAKQRQPAVASSSSSGGGGGGTGSPAEQDAVGTLLLLRAALAALALVPDCGLEAAVRHLAAEFFAVAAKVMPGGRPTGSGAGSMPATAGLLAKLAAEVEAAQVLEQAFSPDAAAELSRHPKLTALRGLLAEYADRSSFHGALFVRTHEATRCLASLLAAAPDLRFLQSVTPCVGPQQRHAALAEFAQPGRRLLVATPEGGAGMVGGASSITAPPCELVVRFLAMPTGRELVQSAGNAREAGTRCVHLLEGAPADAAAARARHHEEAALDAALTELGGLTI